MLVSLLFGQWSALLGTGFAFIWGEGPEKRHALLATKNSQAQIWMVSSLCAYEAKRTSTNPGGEKMLNMVHCLKESFVHDWWVINSVPTMVKLRKLCLVGLIEIIYHLSK